MIKKIHYIWLGHGKKSGQMRKCIQSWKAYFPGWEIIEWNESNLDIASIPYAQEAYDAHKYAFVSDVLRFDILIRHGGVYFDVDVLVKKNFVPLLQSVSSCLGYETDEYVAPGLMMYSAEPGNLIFQEMLDEYKEACFLNPDGTFDMTTVCVRCTNILKKYGLQCDGNKQVVQGITIFPRTFFNPMNYRGELEYYTQDTCTIHLYLGSWLPWQERLKKDIRFFLNKSISLITRIVRKQS